MSNFKRSLVALMAVLLLVGVSRGQGNSQNAPPPRDVRVINSQSEPVPVTGTVSISNTTTNPVPVQGSVGAIPLLPQNAFTFTPSTIFVALSGAHAAPDPSGTRYAITSVTVTNPGGSGEVVLRSVAFSFASTSCQFIVNAVEQADGPRIFVPATTTVHITFPQPFVTAAVSGPQVCLGVGSTGFSVGATWSAVGYKILP